MTYVASSLLCVLLCLGSAQAADLIPPAPTRTFTHGTLGLTVVATEVELRRGTWDVTAVAPKALDQVFVAAQHAPDDGPRGRRIERVELERRIEAGRYPLQSLVGPIREYATTHGGQGPRTFADLDARKWSWALKNLDTMLLVPDVPVPVTAGQGVPAGPFVPLVLELRPAVDDGKHWVLASDGRMERRPIDAALLARHGARIVAAKAKPAPEAMESPMRHLVAGLQRDPTAGTVSLTVVERATGERHDVRWNLAAAQPAGSDLIARWAEARSRDWWPLLTRGDSQVLRSWTERSKHLYGARLPSLDAGTPRGEPRTTDVFNLLGGRAAVRETLQLQLLRASATPEPQTVDVSTIRGVQVKSHPFEPMLRGREGGRVALADLVPPDRFFVYFARPAAVYPALEAGGDFLFRTGAMFTQSAVDDDLKGRYLRRLGLGDRRARQFLESGEVLELALVTPDLFFIDGTDVTVLMRVRAPDRLAARMTLLGFANPSTTGITEKPLGSGRAAYWARRGDVVAVGTNRAELDAVLALEAARGVGSLGRSAEFRYMLTQLPLKKETRAFAYFSDPFVRRMVGPAVKISQLRRMRARADMEMITAGALLYLLDGHRATPELDRLIRLGYVPASVTAGGYRLRDDLSAVSPIWGSPAELTALGAVPVERITAAEAQAYKAYVDEYSQYWRQYFDPIAVRLDDAPGGTLEASTFILPLLDSALYNQLKSFVAPRESGAALRVPGLAPDPVLLLSLNLTDDAWVKVSGSFRQMFSAYTGIHPALFDHFGPGLHVALQDGDPIIALGNADVFGSFAGAMLSADLTRDAWPLLLSMLTRPCKILVELQNEGAVLDILRRSARSGPGDPAMRGMAVEFRQVEGRDAWIYALSIAGVVKVRFGIEVRNGYLVLSNIPWSQPLTITNVGGRELNGADLQIAPGAVRQGLPGLFATHSEQSQAAAVQGMSALYPLLLTVSATPADATARHAVLFGARPLHPGPGTWIWKDGRIASSVYGSASRPQTPVYRPELGDFGLFEGVTRLSVNMQFEADGLRAVARWFWKGK